MIPERRPRGRLFLFGLRLSRLEASGIWAAAIATLGGEGPRVRPRRAAPERLPENVRAFASGA